MKIGELRHRLLFQTITETKDSGGGTIETPVTLATVWGSVAPMTGRELTNAQMRNSEITHKIIIRYLSTVNAKGQVTFGTRVFQIFEVLNIDERNREMHIGAKEVLP